MGGSAHREVAATSSSANGSVISRSTRLLPYTEFAERLNSSVSAAAVQRHRKRDPHGANRQVENTLLGQRARLEKQLEALGSSLASLGGKPDHLVGGSANRQVAATSSSANGSVISRSTRLLLYRELRRGSILRLCCSVTTAIANATPMRRTVKVENTLLGQRARLEKQVAGCLLRPGAFPRPAR